MYSQISGDSLHSKLSLESRHAWLVTLCEGGTKSSVLSRSVKMMNTIVCGFHTICFETCSAWCFDGVAKKGVEVFGDPLAVLGIHCYCKLRYVVSGALKNVL